MHKNATTTAEVRAALQRAEGSDYELARRYGISRTTVRKWRRRQEVEDASHAPKHPRTALSAAQAQLLLYLRTQWQLPLDELLRVARGVMSAKVSRSTIARLLQTAGERPRSVRRLHRTGQLRVDAIGLPDGECLYFAVDRARPWVYAELQAGIDASLARDFLRRLIEAAPMPIERLEAVTDHDADVSTASAMQAAWLRGLLARAQHGENGPGAAIADILQQHGPRQGITRHAALAALTAQFNGHTQHRAPSDADPAPAARPSPTADGPAVPSRPRKPGGPATVATQAPRKRGRPVSHDTQNSILDTAEYLFAHDGYNGVSLNDIANRAGLRKSLASHHFGTKEQLFRAVVARRAEAYTRDLRQALDRVVARAGDRPPTLENLLKALAEPILDWLTRDAQSKAYVQLLAQISAIPGQDALLAPYREHYATVTQAYIAQLRRALPGIRPERLHWAFYVVEATFVHIATETILLESPGQDHGRLTDLDTVIGHVVPFFAAGFRGSVD